MKKLLVMLLAVIAGFMFAENFNVEISVAGIIPPSKDVIELIDEIKTAADAYQPITNFEFREVQQVEYENVDIDTTQAGVTLANSTIFRFEFQMATTDYTLSNLTTIVTTIKGKFYNVGNFEPAIQLRSTLSLEGNFTGIE